MLVDQGDIVSRSYRISATPSAVVIADDGKIAAPTAAGTDAVRQLVDQVSSAERSVVVESTAAGNGKGPAVSPS